MSLSCTLCHKQSKTYIRHFCFPQKLTLATLWCGGVCLLPSLTLLLALFVSGILPRGLYIPHSLSPNSYHPPYALQIHHVNQQAPPSPLQCLILALGTHRPASGLRSCISKHAVPSPRALLVADIVSFLLHVYFLIQTLQQPSTIFIL